MIKLFLSAYPINLAEAEVSDYRQYATFNAFFIRKLAANARQFCQDDRQLLSPVDGYLGQFGYLKKQTLLQAKSHHYLLPELLAGDDYYAEALQDGAYLTAYLAPHNYHRFHMPISAELVEMRYVPGKLYSVNPTLVACMPGLFSQNERVVAFFNTAWGLMAYIAVGATCVGSIAMEPQGIICPPHASTIKAWHYEQPMAFQRGQELGYFQMGSTVILVFAKNTLQWHHQLKLDQAVLVGEGLANLQG